jgi:hypothetical protein
MSCTPTAARLAQQQSGLAPDLAVGPTHHLKPDVACVGPFVRHDVFPDEKIGLRDYVQSLTSLSEILSVSDGLQPAKAGLPCAMLLDEFVSGNYWQRSTSSGACRDQRSHGSGRLLLCRACRR